jgi:hypothetical protein
MAPVRQTLGDPAKLAKKQRRTPDSFDSMVGRHGSEEGRGKNGPGTLSLHGLVETNSRVPSRQGIDRHITNLATALNRFRATGQKLGPTRHMPRAMTAASRSRLLVARVAVLVG